MIQDIEPLRLDNTYRPLLPDAGSVVLSFLGNAVLSEIKNDVIELPRLKDLDLTCDFTNDTVYLFTIGETNYFLARNELEANQRFHYNPVFTIREIKPKYIAYAILTGYGLHVWYSTHIYCGRCGNKNEVGEKERMLFCQECGNIEYPKISPAVIVAVTDGNRLLLSKYAGREYTRYSLLAGFAESGETIEQTIHREVMEEVGLTVKNIRYYKSQPWGLSSSLLFGFFAELDGNSELTVDLNELSEAQWFEREDIPPTHSDRSLTNEMIEYFRNNSRGFNTIESA